MTPFRVTIWGHHQAFHLTKRGDTMNTTSEPPSRHHSAEKEGNGNGNAVWKDSFSDSHDSARNRDKNLGSSSTRSIPAGNKTNDTSSEVKARVATPVSGTKLKESNAKKQDFQVDSSQPLDGQDPEAKEDKGNSTTPDEPERKSLMNETSPYLSLQPGMASGANNPGSNPSFGQLTPLLPHRGKDVAQHAFSQNSRVHSKGLVWGVSIGILSAVICVGALIFYMRRRSRRNPSCFCRRLLPSSSDSNRAVRDRSSYSPDVGRADPSIQPPLSPKKPTFSPRRSRCPSKCGSLGREKINCSLGIRSQTLKDQISAPVIQPPSPAFQRPLSIRSATAPSSIVSAVIRSVSRHYSSTSSLQPPHQQHPLLETVSRAPGEETSARDPCGTEGSLFSARGLDFEEEDVDPGRPSFVTIPSHSTRPRPSIVSAQPNSFPNTLSPSPMQEVFPGTLPATRPLNVIRRSNTIRSQSQPRTSLDFNILDPLHASHESTKFLSNYQEADEAAILANNINADLARISQLTQSTCYSQDSERMDQLMHSFNTEYSPPARASLGFLSHCQAKKYENSDMFSLGELSYNGEQ